MSWPTPGAGASGQVSGLRDDRMIVANSDRGSCYDWSRGRVWGATRPPFAAVTGCECPTKPYKTMLSLALAVLALPTVWIVDANNGPGTNFTDLPAAIATAQNGDTIIVRAGSYTAFFVAGKALTIRGAGPQTSIVDLQPVLPNHRQTTIHSTPPGATFYLSGLGFEATTLGVGAAALNVELGATVVLKNCKARGANISPLGFEAMRVCGSEVHAIRCEFLGGVSHSPCAFVGWCGGAAVHLQSNSRFAADSCTFQGGSFPLTAVGGDGLRISDSMATLSRCNLVGGTPTPNAALRGGDGIAATNVSSVRYSGNNLNLIQGGDGSTSGRAVFSDVSSAVSIHGQVTLCSAICGLPWPATVGPVTLSAAPLPYLNISGTALPGGDTSATMPVVFDLDGVHPNAVYVLAIASQPAYLSAAPFALGVIQVPLLSSVTSFGFLDSTGHRTFSFVPAVLPPLLGYPVYSQAAVFNGAAGQFELSQGTVRFFR